MGDCTVCGKPMRAQRAALADFPGTVLHCGRGVCSLCYQRAKRAAARPPKPKLSMLVSLLSEAEIVTVARMVLARFPNEPELLRMLGVDA